MSVLESSIGWLAPPQCIICGLEGSAFCISCSTTEITSFGARCWRCSALSQRARACSSCQYAGGPRAVWITTDYEDAAQKIIRLFKFGQLRVAAEPLTTMMVQTMLNSLDKTTLQAQDYLIVPIPTATSRVRQRGFDHSALLAKLVARKLRLRYCTVLGRWGQTRQLGAPRAQRLTQQTGSYFVSRPSLVAGRNILLIDDVITTGGTIIEATKVLRAAGARHVDALIFAKKL